MSTTQYAKVAELNEVIRQQRKQLTDVQETIARRNSENAKLNDENAKLRELCADWRKFAYELLDEGFGEPDADDDFIEECRAETHHL